MSNTFSVSCLGFFPIFRFSVLCPREQNSAFPFSSRFQTGGTACLPVGNVCLGDLFEQMLNTYNIKYVLNREELLWLVIIGMYASWSFPDPHASATKKRILALAGSLQKRFIDMLFCSCKDVSCEILLPCFSPSGQLHGHYLLLSSSFHLLRA